MKMISLHAGFVIASIFCCSPLHTQNTSNQGLKFEQLGTILPTPNGYRGMDGAPGPKYWQQRVNQDIECILDTENKRLEGKELVTYYNQSPNTIRYLWLQLADQADAQPFPGIQEASGGKTTQSYAKSRE